MAQNLDPACKAAVNWVTRSFRRITQRKALETGICNCEVTPQAMWPITKSLLKWGGGPKAATAIHGHSGLKFCLIDKVNTIADCLENHFTVRALCDEDHELQVEARVHALLKTVDGNPLIRSSPCDILKLIVTKTEKGVWN